MMKHCTRFFLPLLLLCLSLVAFALVAGAAVETGSCGDNLTYALDTETGVLTISGNGAMTDFYEATPAPWSSYAASVRTVVIEEGVTTIGNMALHDCDNLENISLPSTIVAIGSGGISWQSPFVSAQPDGVYYAGNWAIGFRGLMPETVLLKEGTVGIAAAAFVWRSLTSAEIPASVEYIGQYAFAYSDSLTDVTILNPNCNICDNLGSLPFPETTTLHGYAGSTAETYAKAIGNPFVALATSHTHIYADDFTIDVAANCTVAGSMSRHCIVENCPAKIDVTEIPAPGHSGEWKVSIKPSVTKEGEKIRDCTVCGVVEVEAIPRLSAGDADKDGVITVSDALLVLRTLLSGGAADEYTDMNGDGKLSLLDIVLILKSIKA